MTTTPFDPLEAVQDLEAAGFEHHRAEAVVRIPVKVITRRSEALIHV